MHLSSPRLARAPRFLAVGALACLLAACSGERDAPASASAPPPAPSVEGNPAPAATPTGAAPASAPAGGLLSTGAGDYRFTPQTCAVTREGGEHDIEIEGPGTTPDGEPFWLSFSSTGDELALALGVDKRFASSERSLKAGGHISSPLAVQVEGKRVRVSGIELLRIEERRESVPVPGPVALDVDCGR